MSNSIHYFTAAPETFSLKLNLCCEGCERKLKKLIQKIHGVHSISIDSEQNKVTISGIVDPTTVINELKRHKKSAQLVNNQSMKISVQSRPIQEMHDQNMVSQLEQLSQIKGLKHVEVTYSKTIKLTLKGKNNDESNQESKAHEKVVVVEDDEHGPLVGCGGGHGGTANGQNWMPPPPPPPPPPCRCTNYNPSAPPLSRAYACLDTFGEENPNSCKLM